MVYFPTLPKQCFCTTLQNKHKNCIFSLKKGVAGIFFVEPGVKNSTASITEMFFKCSKCYLLSDMLRVTILSFSRTAYLRIGRVTQLNSCSMKHLTSFLQCYGSQQSGPETRWWQDLGSNAAAFVQDADPQCRRTQAATNWRLEQSAAVLLTLLSMRGESVCRHEFIWREETSNISWRLFW